MNKALSVTLGAYSDAGIKSINQDFFGACIPSEPLLHSKGIALAIADGISSSDVSQVASQTSVASFLDDYYCTPDVWSVKNSVHKVLSATNSWLFSQTHNSPVSYTHLRAHETSLHLVCRLLLEKMPTDTIDAAG